MSTFATPALAFAATGVALRAAAALGCPNALAEIARRASKPAKSVAQLRSRGQVAEAAARIAQAQAPKAQPAPAFAYAQPSAADLAPNVERKLRRKGVMSAMLEALRTDPQMLPPELRKEPTVEAPKAPAAETPAKPKRDTIAAVRKDMDAKFAKTDERLSTLIVAVTDLSVSVRKLLPR